MGHFPPDGQGGSPVVRAFPFSFDTPDILTGAALYTPTIGDILLWAWIMVTTAWDGTTPLGMYGQFLGTKYGIGWAAWSAPYDMTQAAQSPTTTNDSTFPAADGMNVSVPNTNAAAFYGDRDEIVLGRFESANPVEIVVSQDGTNTGADPGSTQGAAVLYLVTATPV